MFPVFKPFLILHDFAVRSHKAEIMPVVLLGSGMPFLAPEMRMLLSCDQVPFYSSSVMLD